MVAHPSLLAGDEHAKDSFLGMRSWYWTVVGDTKERLESTKAVFCVVLLRAVSRLPLSGVFHTALSSSGPDWARVERRWQCWEGSLRGVEGIGAFFWTGSDR